MNLIKIFFIGYKTSDSVKTLYIIFNEVNRYIKIILKILIPLDENKGVIKYYKKTGNKRKNLSRSEKNDSENNDSQNYRHMKSKFNSDDNLPTNIIRSICR